jgi:ABC-type uncharacterized transport system permease subunit
MGFSTVITLLILFIIGAGICWLVYWAVMRLPFNAVAKQIVLCILALLLALFLANYFFGSGGSFPHFSMPRN